MPIYIEFVQISRCRASRIRCTSTLTKEQKEALANGPDFEDFVTGNVGTSEGYEGTLKYKKGGER